MNGATSRARCCTTRYERAVSSSRREPAELAAQAYGRAIADVDEHATAFSHRRTRFEYVAAVKWTEPDEDNLRKIVARETAANLDRFAAGAYVNPLSDEVRRASAGRTQARSGPVPPPSRTPTTRTTSFTSTTTSHPAGGVARDR